MYGGSLLLPRYGDTEKLAPLCCGNLLLVQGQTYFQSAFGNRSGCQFPCDLCLGWVLTSKASQTMRGVELSYVPSDCLVCFIGVFDVDPVVLVVTPVLREVLPRRAVLSACDEGLTSLVTGLLELRDSS